jgi:predicted CoA-binding protein
MSSKAFFKLPLFAVVGASTERSKFGNKVLRAYIDNSFKAIPISKKQSSIEGIPCVESLTALAASLSATEASFNNTVDTSKIGVSIVTPPGATKLILEEAVGLGYCNFFLQPGTYDAEVEEYMAGLKAEKPTINLIQSCVLRELGVDPHA